MSGPVQFVPDQYRPRGGQIGTDAGWIESFQLLRNNYAAELRP